MNVQLNVPTSFQIVIQRRAQHTHMSASYLYEREAWFPHWNYNKMRGFLNKLHITVSKMRCTSILKWKLLQRRLCENCTGGQGEPERNIQHQSCAGLNEIRATPLSLTAAASALLGQVWFAIYVNRRLHSMSVRSLNLSLADSLDLYSPLLRGSFLAVHGPTSWPTSSMEETSSCYVHC